MDTVSSFGLDYFPVLQITATGKSVPQGFSHKAAPPTAGASEMCKEINHPEQNLPSV